MPVEPPHQQADPSDSGDTASQQAAEALINAVPTSAPAIALVGGEPFTQLPLDLYIPPDALEVILEAFEGPLDLLLYLIKRQNLDILNIPISDITAQYMRYIGLMETMRFELAAEYLVMAAMLAEIKSRMLLPRVDEDGDQDEDPRAELIRRLQEYERIKSGAVSLDELPRMEREHQQLKVVPPKIEKDVPLPDVSMKDLMSALRDVAERAERMGHHNISREILSVRARMSDILSVLTIGEFCEFSTLFKHEEGRLGVVVTFLAILELSKDAVIDIVQSEPFAPIYLKPRAVPVEDEDVAEAVEKVADNEDGDSEQMSSKMSVSGTSSLKTSQQSEFEQTISDHETPDQETPE